MGKLQGLGVTVPEDQTHTSARDDHQASTAGAETAVCLTDLEQAARARLPHETWDFAEGGSGDEVTLADNLNAFAGVKLLPKVLAGGSADPSARLVGRDAEMPLAVAPMAYQRLFHPDGEVALAEAARRAGVPFVLSTVGSSSIEEVADVGGTCWFQLYWLRDTTRSLQLIERAEAAGYAALMVTVDVPVMAKRRRDLRNRFALPAHVTPVNLESDAGREPHTRRDGRSAVAAHTNLAVESALSWRDLEWLRERTSLPIVLKGILDPDDADRAVRIGADAVVVSNHGGRQLDGTVPSIVALPAVADAVAGRAEVLLDSGVRCGTDMVRALALGADGVLVGRPLLWGLAAAGVEGSDRVLALLRAEFEETLLLTGALDVRSARHLKAVPVPCAAERRSPPPHEKADRDGR